MGKGIAIGQQERMRKERKVESKIRKFEETTQVPLTCQHLEKASHVPATRLPLEPISYLMKISHQSPSPKHEILFF